MKQKHFPFLFSFFFIYNTLRYIFELYSLLLAWHKDELYAVYGYTRGKIIKYSLNI